jgi:hypothetical protein
VSGTEKATPKNPNIDPKKKIPNIIHNGWRLTFLPIKFGTKKLDSII